MPLRAKIDNQDIFSFNYNENSWEKLKSQYKSMGLTMSCCSAKAIPKTSKLGNFYFAHSVKSNCSSEAESPEHLYIKTLIAKTASKCGWLVKTEWPNDPNPKNKIWEADVYCKKNKTQIVFEVQLSYQTNQITLKRQREYTKSGVRCAWFASEQSFDVEYLYPNKETPFFLITKPKVGVIPKVKNFEVELTDFVEGMLNKRLTWEERPITNTSYIMFFEDECWKCKNKNKQIFGSGFDVYEDRAKTVPNASTILVGILNSYGKKALHSMGLNSISSFGTIKGNAPGFPYCNVCYHCGAPQTNHYLMDKLSNGKIKTSYVEHEEISYSGTWEYKHGNPHT
ncbi:hypothetical protein GCM10009133_18810 [Cocleimonas flava]|uniref:Competence protein CoiA nuclease-like domain-containing protein n=1 Tax=Cocleimonas flava TaxID=634765 RepID=A0A4V2P887_9GAMM|nr:hypothetical protein [Cocleimonas flava]TCJ84805.1 hypothetical protein EV695_2766 [Cocleimonas flava]